MKKRSVLLAGVIVAVLALGACSTDGGGGSSLGISLPGPENLASYSGSEGEPQSEAEASSSASSVDAAVSTELSSIQTVASSVVQQAALRASGTESDTFSGTYPASNGGNVVLTGSVSYTYPDNQSGEGTYSFRANYDADINNVSIDGDNNGSYDSTVDGSSAANYNVTMTVNLNNDGSGSIAISVSGQYGWALSVSSNEPGLKSGKYVLLVNMSGSGSLSFDSDGNLTGGSGFDDAVQISGSLTVYDTNNTQLYQSTLTQNDLDSSDDAFSFFNF